MKPSIIPFCLLALSVPLSAADKVAVRTVLPVKSSAPGNFELPGRTEPVESATIFTRATGIVRERKFDIGEHVKAGEELAVIDVPDVNRAVEAARATVDQVSSRAKTARKVGDRAAALLNANAVSKEESETRLSTETAAKVRFTELPGRIFTASGETTASPSRRPEVISTIPSPRRPSVTGCRWARR